MFKRYMICRVGNITIIQYFYKNINLKLKYNIIENLLILFIKYLFFVYTKISYNYNFKPDKSYTF